MEKNILIEKIIALNIERKKLQGEVVEASRDKGKVKPECAQKILKATTRNHREHRAQDKLEAIQQRKAPSTQNDITQSTRRSNCEKSNMEDGEDQMYRGT